MRSAPAPSGTLEEGQVRAMFDRIAGFYDVMNSVMTAGLHHRWRERAADLARVGPGDRALDVATGTGDLALELARRVRPGRRGGRLGLLARGCSSGRGRRRRRAGHALGVGQRARAALPRRRASTPRRSASARATSRTSSAGWPRWRASCARAGAWSCWRSRRRRGRRCRRSSRSGSIASCRARALRRRPRGLHLPAEVGEALPGPGGARRRAGARRPDRRALDPDRRRDHRPAFRYGALMASAEAGRRGHRGRRRARPRSCSTRLEVRLAEVAASHGPVLAEHAGATISAGGKRLRPLLVFVAAGPPADGGERRAARRGRGRARPLGDARARRRPRRRAAAPRPPDRGRRRGPRAGDRHRRPAVLARVRRARRQRPRRRDPRALRRLLRARRGRADAARRRVERRDVARALPRPLRPQDRAPVRGRLRARRRSRAAGRPSCSAASGAASGSRSSCSTTCSTSQARPSGRASTAARTCSTAR